MRAVRVAIVSLFTIAFAACSHQAGGDGTPPLASGASGALTAPDAASVGTIRTRNTAGRIGLAQIFDYFPSTGTAMTSTQIQSDASRYDMVWGSFNPNPWRYGSSSVSVSRYYIPEEDNTILSQHNLTWWKANHPDWILYACDASGNPTQQYAYTPGVGFADVVLDIHNPAVVNYQIRQSLAPYAIAHNYTSLAIDQVIFKNVLVGGNPKLGQSIISGYYGCGIYQNGSFVRRYTGPNDPQFTTDILNWVKTARSILTSDPTIGPKHLALFVNHPQGSTSNANEQALYANVDGIIDESAFSDYGAYQQQSKAGIFLAKVNYMKYLQAHNVTPIMIDKFAQDGATVTSNQLEYSIATYLMGNEQSADLEVVGNNGKGYGYGAEQWHQEYATPIGAACGEMYGGASYDSANPQIYYRRFAGGISVVNSGSLPRASETATLPTNHTYTDIEGRPVSNPLTVNSNDAYVLTTTNGCN